MNSRVKRTNAGVLSQSVEDAIGELRRTARQLWFIVQFDGDKSYMDCHGADDMWSVSFTEVMLKKRGDSCRRKFITGKGVVEWWDGIIVAVGSEAKIKKKLAEYESQLKTTSEPVLQQTFVELPDSDEELCENFCNQNTTPRTITLSQEYPSTSQPTERLQSDSVSCSHEPTTSTPLLSSQSSKNERKTDKKSSAQELVAKLCVAVEANAAANVAVANAITRFSASVETFGRTVEQSQKNFVDEYSKFRRETRELKEVIRKTPLIESQLDASSSNAAATMEPVLHEGVDLLEVSHSDSVGPFARSVARTLWSTDEIMFRMISPRKSGRLPVTPTRKRKFRSAVEKRFRSVGGDVYKEARESVVSLGNELRSVARAREDLAAEQVEKRAAICLENGDNEEAQKLGDEAKKMRKETTARFNVKENRNSF